MMSAIACLLLNSGLTVLLGFLFAFSEYLGQNEKIKANSVYQFVRNFLIAATKNNKKES
jgi:hypothetical protein